MNSETQKILHISYNCIQGINLLICLQNYNLSREIHKWNVKSMTKFSTGWLSTSFKEKEWDESGEEMLLWGVGDY